MQASTSVFEIKKIVFSPVFFFMTSQSLSSSLSLIRKNKVAFLHFNIEINECESPMCCLFLCTSACPDPSCWWSGSSVRWWRPARPSAAALELDPPESSHSLDVKNGSVQHLTKQSTTKLLFALHNSHHIQETEVSDLFVMSLCRKPGGRSSQLKTLLYSGAVISSFIICLFCLSVHLVYCTL